MNWPGTEGVLFRAFVASQVAVWITPQPYTPFVVLVTLAFMLPLAPFVWKWSGRRGA